MSYLYRMATPVAYLSGPQPPRMIPSSVRSTAVAPRLADLTRIALCIFADSSGANRVAVTVPSSTNAFSGRVLKISTSLGSVGVCQAWSGRRDTTSRLSFRPLPRPE